MWAWGSPVHLGPQFSLLLSLAWALPGQHWRSRVLDSAKLHAGAAMVATGVALPTGLSPLPSTAHHLVWDLEPPTKTWQTHVYQQTEKTESRGALAEGATDVVERCWATDQDSRRADGLLLGGRGQGWGEEACQHKGIVGAKEWRYQRR